MQDLNSDNEKKRIYIDWDKVNAPPKCINRLEKRIEMGKCN